MEIQLRKINKWFSCLCKQWLPGIKWTWDGIKQGCRLLSDDSSDGLTVFTKIRQKILTVKWQCLWKQGIPGRCSNRGVKKKRKVCKGRTVNYFFDWPLADKSTFNFESSLERNQIIVGNLNFVGRFSRRRQTALQSLWDASRQRLDRDLGVCFGEGGQVNGRTGSPSVLDDEKELSYAGERAQ